MGSHFGRNEFGSPPAFARACLGARPTGLVLLAAICLVAVNPVAVGQQAPDTPRVTPSIPTPSQAAPLPAPKKKNPAELQPPGGSAGPRETRSVPGTAQPSPPSSTQNPADSYVYSDQEVGDYGGRSPIIGDYEPLPMNSPHVVGNEFPIDPDATIISPAPARPASPPGGGQAPFRAGAFWMPKQDFADGQDSLSISGQRMTLAFPVSMSDEGGIWLATTSIDHVAMSSNRLLPDSGIPIPDDLWNITFGGMHFRTLSNGWETGGILTFGSASDKPFEETRDFTATALGFVTIPTRANNAWKLSLFYSPTAQLNFPLPGFAYVWRPNPVWEWNLGLPFSVSYKPNDFFSANASYVPLTNFNACATWQWSPLWSTFASYAITNETYWLTARTDDDDRFFLFDQRLAIGVRRQLARGFALEFSTAYIFDRTIFQGAGFSDRYDELDIDPGVAGILQLSWNR